MTSVQNITPFSRLLHPYNTSLITCCNNQGKTNIITIAWIIPVSVNPPLLTFAIRPNRYSYELIRETGEFVVNIASQNIAQQALYCGRHSGSDVDKFKATKLTSAAARKVKAPIIQECIAHIECRLSNEVEAGDHQLIIGDVLIAYCQKDYLAETGLYDLSIARPLLHLGGNYFTSTLQEATEPKI